MKISVHTKKFVIAFIISAGITILFLLPYCDFIYNCGCTYLWAGAADQCNVHQPDVPHCPWCEERNPILMSLPFVAIFAGQGFSIRFFNNKYKSSLLRLILIGIAAFLVLGAVSGYIFKLMDDYPYFFYQNL